MPVVDQDTVCDLLGVRGISDRYHFQQQVVGVITRADVLQLLLANPGRFRSTLIEAPPLNMAGKVSR